MNTNIISPSDDSPDEPKQRLITPEWSIAKIKAMRYQHRPTKDGLWFKMPGPRGWVQAQTVCTAWALFWRSAHTLDANRLHTTEGLACTPDWSSRPEGERRAMGRCFKYFSLHGVLPITLANPEAPYNFKYRLNDDLDQAPTLH
jgi:hypothetical protein